MRAGHDGRNGRISEDISARAAIRAFARRHHPDVGGDPEVFAAGLAELRAQRQPESTTRYDAPVVVLDRPGGLRGIARRLRARRDRRQRRRVR